MNAKVIKTGEILDLYPYHSGYWIDLKTQYLYRESNLEFLPDTPEEVTIEGYVARDKGGGLYLHWEQPRRGVLEWHTPFGNPRKMPDNSFPSVTWGSEPKRVKITITPMEDET